MHDGTRWRDRLCLHGAARTARNDARPARQQKTRARSRHRDRAASRTPCYKGIMMSVERKPVSFDGMRGWLDTLEKAGEIKHVNGEVDWNIELGTIARLLQGPA